MPPVMEKGLGSHNAKSRGSYNAKGRQRQKLEGRQRRKLERERWQPLKPWSLQLRCLLLRLPRVPPAWLFPFRLLLFRHLLIPLVNALAPEGRHASRVEQRKDRHVWPILLTEITTTSCLQPGTLI